MDCSPEIVLFNPRAVSSKNYRIPNSILQVAASIDEGWSWSIVDGNRENSPWEKILGYLERGSVRYFGVTVMPGPQLRQAVLLTKKVKNLYPNV